MNYDETNLTDDPGAKKCVFKRGTKYPERVLNSSKSAVSLMFAGTASGEVLPPYVCYKAERLWDTWVVGGPEGTRYNRSKSGWIDEITFTDWFKTIALPWAKSKEGKKVMIGDNLSTHFSPEVVKLCEDNDILFVCMPPNATHLLQPLDVAFFRPLKHAWREILGEWKLSADRRLSSLPKNHFPHLLGKLMDAISGNAGKNLQAGFKACGIVPLNANVVLAKLPTNSVEESPTKKAVELVGEGVIDLLSKLRYDSPGAAKRIKKKKINVAPGKSVSQSDFVDNTRASTSKDANVPPKKPSMGKKRKRSEYQDPEDSTGSSNPDDPDEMFTDVNINESPVPVNEANEPFKDPEVGDWLLVKFCGKKSTKYYVVVVEDKNIDLFVRCARHIDRNNFKWADPEDRCTIDYDQIEKRLKPPKFNFRNDRLVNFTFESAVAGDYIVS